MYADHFGLAAEPFNLTPDPAFLYLSQEHREALAAVQYGLIDGRGFITLVGEVGTGKTTLLYSILSRRHADLTAAYVSYSAQSFEGLLGGALRDLGVSAPPTGKRELLETLNDFLRRQADQGRNTALIIDEAQNLSDETFEELRLLSNFESYTRKLLQIVLVGQPELSERLHQPRLRQLRERISVRATVNPLSRDEMAGYVAHRLKVAGGDVDQVFSPRALRAIVRRTKGIPRRANILCHNALLFAFGRHLPQVGQREAREAIAEMDERRPGWVRRAALRRVRWGGEAWRWAAAVGGAFAIGTAGTLLWTLPSNSEAVPSTTAAAPVVEPVAPAAPAAVIAPVAPGAAAVSAAPPRIAPPADAPVRRAEQAAVVPPSAPEPSEDEETSVAEKTAVAADVAADDTRAVVVPEGGALWKILRQAYGPQFATADRAAIYDRVRKLNPQVKDVNVIMAGDRIVLPNSPRVRP